MKFCDNYCIKAGYQPNPRGNLTKDANDRHYWTEQRIKSASTLQYDVYLAARRVAKQHKLKNVIDIGCGPATKTIDLLGPVCNRLVGIDQQNTISFCTQTYPQHEFYADDLESPSLDLGDQFDLIVCVDVIEHVNNPDVLIEYAAKVAVDGGWLVISTPERDMVRGPDCMACEKPDHVREWNSSEFSKYLSSRGIHITDHRLVPWKRMNIVRAHILSPVQDFYSRQKSRSCQLAVCRIWKRSVRVPKELLN